jgi:23S rRNA (adenine2030-N6)-methyltransferase
MLSYLHSFHAGNHADVIKHITLVGLLDKLQQKPKPFFYLDTHAGDGAYDTQESINKDPLLATDITRLCRDMQDDTPTYIKQYANIIAPYLDKKLYPGSPLVAFEKISALPHMQHNLHLSEMHPSAFDGLRTWTTSGDFQLHKRDGFELLNALVPPKPNRGMVLIDPPYEQAQEYQQVIDALAHALKKWPQGIFAIWFPLLSPTRLDRKTQEITNNPKSGLSEKMLKQLANIAAMHKSGMLELRFVKQRASEKIGMYGSGMVIINPPWQFDESIASSLDALFQSYSAVNQDSPGQMLSYLKHWRKPE